MGIRKKAESSIEKSACAKAFQRYGVRSFKMNGPGRRGNPDRLFYWRERNLLFIEFKRPGEEPEPLQLHVHHILRDCGFQVEVCDNVEDALQHIRLAVERGADYD